MSPKENGNESATRANALLAWLILNVGKTMNIGRHSSKSDLDAAHKFSSIHRKDVEGSEMCGCFYCLSVFQPKLIEEWVDEDEKGVAQTALCPRCGIDSIIGAKSGFPITKEFLSAMHRRWFNV